MMMMFVFALGFWLLPISIFFLFLIGGLRLVFVDWVFAFRSTLSRQPILFALVVFLIHCYR